MRKLSFILIAGLLLGLCACGSGGPLPVNSVTEIDGTMFVLYNGAIYREGGEGWSQFARDADEMVAYDGRIYYLSQGGKHCTLMQLDGTVDYESDLAYAMRSPQALRRNDFDPCLLWVSCISVGERGHLRLFQPGNAETTLGIAPGARDYCKAGLWFYYATKTKLFAAREDGHYIGIEAARGKDIANLQANGDGSILYYSDKGLLYSLEATGLAENGYEVLPFPAPRQLSEDASTRWVVDEGSTYYVSDGALHRLDLASLEKNILAESGCVEAVSVAGGMVYYAAQQGFWRIDPGGGMAQQLIP